MLSSLGKLRKLLQQLAEGTSIGYREFTAPIALKQWCKLLLQRGSLQVDN